MALRKVFSLSILVISLFCSCKPKACECDIVWKREEGGLGLLVAEEETLRTCKIFYTKEEARKICRYIRKSYEEEQVKKKRDVVITDGDYDWYDISYKNAYDNGKVIEAKSIPLPGQSYGVDYMKVSYKGKIFEFYLDTYKEGTRILNGSAKEVGFMRN